MPRIEGRNIRSEVTSLGHLARAIWLTLTTLIDDLPDVPSERRVRLRTHRAALERAYPELTEEVAVMQQLAEEDGDAVPEDI